jgi:hypothetical protein
VKRKREEEEGMGGSKERERGGEEGEEGEEEEKERRKRRKRRERRGRREEGIGERSRSTGARREGIGGSNRTGGRTREDEGKKQKKKLTFRILIPHLRDFEIHGPQIFFHLRKKFQIFPHKFFLSPENFQENSDHLGGGASEFNVYGFSGIPAVRGIFFSEFRGIPS